MSADSLGLGRVGKFWADSWIVYLGMNHNFILWTESDRTFGTFEETNQKIIMNVANKIVKTSKYFATQLKKNELVSEKGYKDHKSLLKC